ncbi:MAG: nitrilase-related carbon-nitrogen hydrolase, partial [Bdellovibrionota bacterium]
LEERDFFRLRAECASQLHVLAAAQGGEHKGLDGSTRGTYGHSMIIDPWGEVVQTLPDDFGDRRILRARLSRERIQKVRTQIPMRSHRRLI